MKLIVCIIVLISLMTIGAQASAQGVDVSIPVTETEWQCLNRTIQFAIVRAYHSYGAPDTNAPQTIKDAWNGGIQSVSAYIFPCFKCSTSEYNPKSAKAQIEEAVNALSGIKVHKWWLDIEGASSYWGTDTAANLKFIKDMVSELKSLGLDLGIYTSHHSWVPITGCDTSMSDIDLWWPRYQSPPNPHQAFEPFCGWNRAEITQWGDSGCGDCGSSCDVNTAY
eukprot:TRINITY_DN2870_c0_g2_i1.p1 TRINITY_DN2870_c0_g2~~TRINITY_DN2870_c0_g2_i1.p1  ORF type:complete len:223 (+),score=43.50 TRINITY_DN2870_c0_g2_i1:840-1508(+)